MLQRHIKAGLYVQCLYNVCTVTVQLLYKECTDNDQDVYNQIEKGTSRIGKDCKRFTIIIFLCVFLTEPNDDIKTLAGYLQKINSKATVMISDGKIKIIIADSQFLIIEALKAILIAEGGFSIEAVASTSAGLNRILAERSPDLLITDISLPDDYGIKDIIKIKSDYPGTAVLILTNSLTKHEFLELQSCGLRDIIYKTADREEILDAVEAALKGKRYLAEEILDMLIEPAEINAVNNKPEKLTSSEIEIVKLVSNGLTAKEIALKKHLSIHTVNTHRKNIFRKLKVSNVSELMMVAIKAGWIDNIEYYI